MKEDIKKIIFFFSVFFTTLFIIIFILPKASAQEIEFDSKYAQQQQVFKLLTWETTNCMDDSALSLLRMGQRDMGEIASFLAKTCGTQFYKYSTQELKIDKDRVVRLLLAMAIEEIKRTPGVKFKK